MRRSRASSGGFTILEIMIATAILTLGLVGILALFPVAIHSGKQVVEKSTAMVVAESVAEAIRDGIRNQLRYDDRSGDIYFIFKHDGVTDEVPTTRSKESPRRDYFILLPKHTRSRFSGRTARKKAFDAAKTFVYPETDRPANGGGTRPNSRRADDDGNDFVKRFKRGVSYKDVFVEKTYTMGTIFPKHDATGERVLDDQKIDAIKQYSYAFAITPSFADANKNHDETQFVPAGRLFHVRIMVFRAFPPGAPDKDVDPEIPIFELDFEVVI